MHRLTTNTCFITSYQDSWYGASNNNRDIWLINNFIENNNLKKTFCSSLIQHLRHLGWLHLKQDRWLVVCIESFVLCTTIRPSTWQNLKRSLFVCLLLYWVYLLLCFSLRTNRTTRCKGISRRRWRTRSRGRTRSKGRWWFTRTSRTTRKCWSTRLKLFTYVICYLYLTIITVNGR